LTTLIGWNTAADGTGTGYQPGDNLTPTGNITLYAQWQRNQYTVTVDPNGGDAVGADSVRVSGGSSVSLPDSGWFSRAGWTLTGWNTAADGTGTGYLPNEVLTPTADITLYAQWRQDTPPVLDQFTVTFHGGGSATGAITLRTVDEGATLTLPGNWFTRDGFMFSGWNTAVEGTGDAYQPGDTLTLTGNITLYAQWRANTTPAPSPTPSIQMGVSVLHRGDTQTVTGTGFASGEVVTVVMHSDAPVTLGSVVVGQDGSFRFTFTVPTSASVGQHTITVTGAGSGSAQATFEVLADTPDPSPQVTPVAQAPATELPETGAGDIGVWLAFAVLALAIGSGLLLTARRLRGAVSQP
jgi:uncharacterized repeat protein (TIGR02543 family)/LPXTG-motif cell wall-anchored protein